MTRCAKCGEESPDNIKFCITCGTRVRPETESQKAGENRAERRDVEAESLELAELERIVSSPMSSPDHPLRISGGVAIIAAGALMLLAAVAMVAVMEIAENMTPFDIGSHVYVAAAAVSIIGVLVVFSGFGAVQGRRWVLALIGSVIPMFFGGLLLILGVLGLVFVTATREEFKD